MQTPNPRIRQQTVIFGSGCYTFLPYVLPPCYSAVPYNTIPFAVAMMLRACGVPLYRFVAGLFLLAGKVRPEEAVQATLSSLPEVVVETVGASVKKAAAAAAPAGSAKTSERQRKLDKLRQEEQLIKVLYTALPLGPSVPCSLPPPRISRPDNPGSPPQAAPGGAAHQGTVHRQSSGKQWKAVEGSGKQWKAVESSGKQ